MPEQKPKSQQRKSPETIEQGRVVQNEQEAQEMLELHKREEAQRDDTHDEPMGAGKGRRKPAP